MRWIPLAVALACTGSDKDTAAPDTTPYEGDTDSDADADTDADADADADTDSDTDTDPTGDTSPTGDTTPEEFLLWSPDMVGHKTKPCQQQLPQFAECQGFGGLNLNPQLEWSGVPPGTVSLALLFDDMDFEFPAGNPADHWGVYDIPPTETMIVTGASGTNPPNSLPAGAMEISPYSGSCSNGANYYRWRLIALDAAAPGTPNNLAAIEAFAAKHALGIAEMCHCPETECTF